MSVPASCDRHYHARPYSGCVACRLRGRRIDMPGLQTIARTRDEIACHRATTQELIRETDRNAAMRVLSRFANAARDALALSATIRRFRTAHARENLSMEFFLTSTLTVAIAEIGDKTQLLALLLAARFRRPWAIAAGILVATLLNHALAGWLGAWAAQAEWRPGGVGSVAAPQRE